MEFDSEAPARPAWPRRQFLTFAAAMLGSACAVRRPEPMGALIAELAAVGGPSAALPFVSVRGPLPLATDGLRDEQRPAAYAEVAIADGLVVPQGYVAEPLIGWGDTLGAARCGYNCDYLAFTPTGPDRGLLTINFEYLSAAPWLDGLHEVHGDALDVALLRRVLGAAGELGIDATALPLDDARRALLQRLGELGMGELGIAVVAIARDPDGRWRPVDDPATRRISGLSGRGDEPGLRATGPAAAVFARGGGRGYDDGLGAKIVGTFGNCGGGVTPWGTVLSAEENIQDVVVEDVFADGTPLPPSTRPVVLGEMLTGIGNPLGLAGHKYGWIVEVDPRDPTDMGTKHTWLGRFRHEAVGVRVVPGLPLVFYSGCDRRGGHLYKYVSRELVGDPSDRRNSRLLGDGTLYAAQFAPDGQGRWIPLRADTPVAPVAPSHVVGGMVMVPNRPGSGRRPLWRDDEAATFAERYPTLGHLYAGHGELQQGAILIDAHLAATAAGATPTARPEDTVVAADGTLYVAFTEGMADEEGGPDKRIFRGPDGRVPWVHGWLVRLAEAGGDPAATTFVWRTFALGGEPAEGGAGFANPDNLMLDDVGHLWVVTDMSSGGQNRPIGGQREGSPIGVFGTNGLYCIPLRGPGAGRTHCFALGPPEAELTGPCLSPDRRTLFLSVQHPGEAHGQRRDGAADVREFLIRLPDGNALRQRRTVPLGSNWPRGNGHAPRPTVVAIRRLDGAPIV